MFPGVREFLNSTAGKAVAGVVIVAVAVIGFFSVRSSLGDSDAVRLSHNKLVFIDSTTGKTFTMAPSDGMTVPVKAPSGGNTGYLAEACYWTADGKPKSDPTYVLLEGAKNPASKEPTFCPDCGRLVVARNPMPGDASSAPPTKQEYQSRSR